MKEKPDKTEKTEKKVAKSSTATAEQSAETAKSETAKAEPKEEVANEAPVRQKKVKEESRPVGRALFSDAFVFTESLLEAKLLVWAECPYLQKTKASGLPYRFASEADLIGKLRPAMVKFGVVVSPEAAELVSDKEYQSANNKLMRRVVVRIRYRFQHVWTGQQEVVEMMGEAADTGDKAINKAQTDAMKYAIRQWAMIETGDDPDKTSSESYEVNYSVQKEPRANEESSVAPPTNANANGHQNGQQSGQPSGQAKTRTLEESFRMCLQSLKNAADTNTLNVYRDVYVSKRRRYEPQQVEELEKAYHTRLAQLTKTSEYQDESDEQE